MDKPTVSLKRTITLPLLLFYGLGNIIGAGIYVSRRYHFIDATGPQMESHSLASLCQEADRRSEGQLATTLCLI
ncbi:MAG: hypothetical protein OEU36_19770 [Gammaproteobacteria bacterium]|nr:hypothetical protein [Gammaproteobacteria bacterium]